MTPSRRVLALAAGALAAVGLVALPAASSPASATGGDVLQRLHDAQPAPVHGLDARLSKDHGPALAKGKVHAAPQKVNSAGQQTVYVDGSDPDVLRQAVRSVGGKVTGSLPGLVRADVPADALSTLAGKSGVQRVRPPVVPVADAVTSEGVAASGADAWQTVGTGAGVKVGIVDVGFGGLANAQAAGDLPATGPTTLSVVAEAGCTDVNLETHGTAVTEIVHDMAPDAQLFLVCIGDVVDLGTAADFLQTQGVSVVNMSLGFPGSLARGDGTGEIGDIIKQSRQQGLLWSIAAGNEGQQHFRGKATDANGNGFLQFAGTDEFNSFTVAANGEFLLTLQWEKWPITTTELDVILMGARHLPTGPDDPDLLAVITGDQASVGPFEPVTIADLINQDPVSFPVFAMIGDVNVPGGTQFDLQVEGDVSPLQHETGGSIGEPANSPYAMAVGAACVKDGTLEPFSSQGPTVDGRTKPDITAFDGVSTTTFGPASTGTTCDGGFLGTSSAAPHATGAAALVKSANPGFDAAQIENYLEKNATPKGTANQFGHGVLNMGPQQTPQAPRGDTYQPLATPTRVLDTRTSIGGHQAKVGGGETLTLTVPGLAADATAVAINLTGTNPTAGTHVDVFPVTWTGTSTLNLDAKQTAAVFTMVALGPNHTIKIRNNTGQVDMVVDLLGSFTPSGGVTFVPKNPPARVLDTRTSTGGHLGKIGSGETFALQVSGVAGVPADATAVIVNVTGVNQTNSTHVDVFPDQPTGTSTLNLDGTSLRSNVTAVAIGPDGKIRIHNFSGSVNVIVDLQGWFVPTGGSRFVALDPTTRILDTRSGIGLHLGELQGGETIQVQASKLYGVPYDATAVAFNLTIAGPSAQTFLTTWPAGLPRPTTSNVNLLEGQVVPNAAVVGTGTNGMVSLFNNSGTTRAVADIYGYFIP